MHCPEATPDLGTCALACVYAHHTAVRDILHERKLHVSARHPPVLQMATERWQHLVPQLLPGDQQQPAGRAQHPSRRLGAGSVEPHAHWRRRAEGELDQRQLQLCDLVALNTWPSMRYEAWPTKLLHDIVKNPDQPDEDRSRPGGRGPRAAWSARWYLPQQAPAGRKCHGTEMFSLDGLPEFPEVHGTRTRCFGQRTWMTTTSMTVLSGSKFRPTPARL